MGDKIRILKIDIDKSPAAADTYQVQSVPTLILFQNGEVLWRKSGVLQATQLEKIIEQYITKN
jgi:thioredoxin 1